jgi:arylsulfatase A-like enzyme
MPHSDPREGATDGIHPGSAGLAGASLTGPGRGRSWTALGLVLLLCGALGCGGRRPPPPLILLVTVDTLRADHIGAYGSPDPTPHIDALARDSVLFEIAYGPAPFTFASISALLTGQLPRTVGAVTNRSFLAADVPTLATRLQAAGFATGAVVSSDVLKRSSGLARGFDVFDDHLPVTAFYMPERDAPETTRAALAALDQLLAHRPAPAFLWVHYQDPHGPYTPPLALRDRYLPTEMAAPDGARKLPVYPIDRGWGAIPRYQAVDAHREVGWYRAGYRGEIAWMDEGVGALLDGVAARGLADTALIIFTADHGESLGEDDYWFAHGEHLSDAQLRVPLILHVPGVPPARRTDVASLVDVAPTLVALLGLDPIDGTPGRDLLSGEPPRPLLIAALRNARARRVGVVTADEKYTISFDPVAVGHEREEKLLALRPDYARVPITDPARLEAARELVRDLQIEVQAHAHPVVRRVLTADDERKLQALGYVEIGDEGGRGTPGHRAAPGPPDTGGAPHPSPGPTAVEVPGAPPAAR